jgi:hypothetical protein
MPPPNMGPPPVSPFSQELQRPSEGKMFLRMIVVQAIQSKIINRKTFSFSKKIVFLFLIFLGMLGYDIFQFFESKNIVFLVVTHK